MKCNEAVKAISAQRGDAVIVATMTAIKWMDQFDPSGLNIACVPLMGGASGLGLGLSLARPERLVVVLDGDGSLLMQLGSLVTASGAKPSNFVHFVFKNDVWFENLANLPVPAATSVDYVRLAEGAGYRSVFRTGSVAELEDMLPAIFAGSGPVFVELTIEPEAGGLWSANNPQPDLKDFHFTRMGDEIRRVRQAIAGHAA